MTAASGGTGNTKIDGILNPYISVLMFIVAACFLVWAWRRKTHSPSLFHSTRNRNGCCSFNCANGRVPSSGRRKHMADNGQHSCNIGSRSLRCCYQPHNSAHYSGARFWRRRTNQFRSECLQYGGHRLTIVFHCINAPKEQFEQEKIRRKPVRCVFVLKTLTALAVGLQIGINPLWEPRGIAVTVPTMLFWYVPT